jgi:hypothetical protein
MRASVRAFIAIMVVSVLAVSVLSLAVLAYRGSSRPAPGHSPEDEVLRVRGHLAAVEAALLAADVSQLTPAQRAARSHHIAILREYRDAGVFPHNHTVADRRVPVFVDEHGTHCAVGYLLARDGHHEVVERVRTTRNNATVPELADDPDLVAWLAQAGLTLEEAARIQPWYGPINAPVETNDRFYRNATFVATGLGVGISAWNLAVAGNAAGRSLPGTLGAGAGAAEIALGAVGLIDRAAARDNTRGRVQPAYIAINFGVGVVTTALGLRNLLRGESDAPRTIDAGPAARQGLQWQLSPWSPAMDGGAGVRLDVQF